MNGYSNVINKSYFDDSYSYFLYHCCKSKNETQKYGQTLKIKNLKIVALKMKGIFVLKILVITKGQ